MTRLLDHSGGPTSLRVAGVSPQETAFCLLADWIVILDISVALSLHDRSRMLCERLGPGGAP